MENLTLKTTKDIIMERLIYLTTKTLATPREDLKSNGNLGKNTSLTGNGLILTVYIYFYLQITQRQTPQQKNIQGHEKAIQKRRNTNDRWPTNT